MKEKESRVYKCRWCGKLEFWIVEYESGQSFDDAIKQTPQQMQHNCESDLDDPRRKIGICDLIGFREEIEE